MTVVSSGDAAEAKILAALTVRGFAALIPFGNGLPYDLVIHLGGTSFLRVQCKTAWENRGCIVFNSRCTDHGRGRLPYTGLADLFGVYFPPNDEVYLVPVAETTGFQGRLRLMPTRNGQRKLIRNASDYEIDRWTSDALSQTLP